MAEITKAVIIIPKVTGAVSILCSGYIIHDLVRVRAEKLKETKNLLLMLMNVFDLLYTFFYWFLGTWLSPKGMGIYGAVGNTASCEAQGYLSCVFCSITIAYNVLMAIVFLLIVRYQWKEPRLTRMRPFLIYIPIVFFAVYWMPVLIMDGFNSTGVACDVTRSPMNCGEDPEVECERGEDIYTYGLIIGIILMGTPNIVLICTMSMLYWTVLQVEKRMDRYSPDERVNRTRSKQVGVQGLLYVVAYYLAWIPFISISILYGSGVVLPQWLILIVVTTNPLQGFWNALIYLRPRYLKYRKDHPDQSLWNIMSTRIRSVTKKSAAATQEGTA